MQLNNSLPYGKALLQAAGLMQEKRFFKMKKWRREVLSDCHKSAFLSFLGDAVPGEEDA